MYSRAEGLDLTGQPTRLETSSPGASGAVVCALAAAWFAMDSTGVLASTLQLTLSWLALAVATALARPRVSWRGLLVAAVVLALMATSQLRAGADSFAMPLTVVAVLALLAAGRHGVDRRLLLIGGLSVLGLVLFRFSQNTIPIAWNASDMAGGGLATLVGLITQRPLDLGATFAGLDFLVVTGIFFAGWLISIERRRGAAALLIGSLILGGHFVYLTVLAYTSEITQLVPPATMLEFLDPYVPPNITWSMTVEKTLPWNLPFLAVLIHGTIALLMTRWAGWNERVSAVERSQETSPGARTRYLALTAILMVLAVLTPVAGYMQPTRTDLHGQVIVANEQGQMDWNRPQHGSYGHFSAGTYGMLPWFAESLGAEMRWTSNFSSADLQVADIVLLVQPDETLTAEQQDRIWQFVREGGSLLVVADGFDPEVGPNSITNEFLRPAKVGVTQDAAVPGSGSWVGTCQLRKHAATRSIDAQRTRFLSDSGASLQIGWRASPIVVGRWGWSAPQKGAIWTRDQQFHDGEKLGDLVLAAEQQVGQGRLIVVGNDFSFTNLGLVDGHVFVADLLRALSDDAPGTERIYKFVALVFCLAILACLLFGLDAPRLVLIAVLLSAACTQCKVALRTGEPHAPSGRRIKSTEPGQPENRLAYIGASHLETYSHETWESDSLNALMLSLMRNGYLPLTLPEITSANLADAGLLILVAPAQSHSPAERQIITEFVRRGGILVFTVGAEQARASSPLLADLGFRVPASPVATGDDSYEPEPFGQGRAPYLDIEDEAGDSYQANLRYFAGWPVESTEDGAEVVAYARNQLPVIMSQTQLPIAMGRSLGEGTVIVIGDSCFAMNKNLEYVDGRSFSKDYENSHFWRWLIATAAGLPDWVPARTTTGTIPSDHEDPAEGES